MHTGVTIRRKSGLFVLEDYAKLALSKNTSAWGAAVVKQDGLMIAKGDSACDLEVLQNTQEEFKDNDIYFYLCSTGAAVNIDDVSPYTILHNQDVPQLIAFIDGKFPAHEKTGSSHPGAFFIANEFLIPKLKDIYDLTDGNIEKVMAFVKKDNFRTEFLSNIVDNGNLTLVAANGDSLSLVKGCSPQEFDWGWTSDNYAASVKAEPPQEEPKKKSMFSGKSTVREPAPVQSTKSDPVTPPKTETAIQQPVLQVVKMTIPNNLSRSNKKDLIKARIGYLPHNWQHLNSIEVYADASGKDLTKAQVQKLGLSAVGLPVLNNPPAQEHRQQQTEHVQSGQTIDTKPVQTTTDKKVSTEILPVMSPATREHIRKIMADPSVQKLIGENAKVIHDPTKLKQLEEKFATFCAQLGIKKMDDFMCWDFKMMFDLARERPDGAALMCWTFRNMLASRMQAEQAEEIKEVPPQQSQTAPKRSMFAKAG